MLPSMITRIRTRTGLSGLLAVFGLLLVSLQIPGSSALAKKQPEMVPLLQRERTVLVQVDVRVEDKAGNAVHGLRAEDFILVVDREPQEIETFEEIITAAPPQDTPDSPVIITEGAGPRRVSPSYFIFFFDNVMSNHFERRQAVRTADRMLEEVLQEGDRFTAVALGRQLKVLSGMTTVSTRPFGSFAELLDDRQILDSYADEREFRVAEVQQQYKANPELGKHLARSYAIDEGNRVHKVLASVRSLLTALEPIRERKLLLYFSTGVPLSPGAQYLHIVELDKEIRDSTRTTMFALRRLFREANSGRVSIFPIDLRGMDHDFPIQQAPPSMDIESDPFAVDRIDKDYAQSRDGLVSLALNTGGKAILNTNDLTGALKQAVGSSRHYYLLGFTPRSGGDGKYHKISVRLWDSKWRVNARSGFMDFNPTQVDERQILGSFVLPDMFNELPLKLEIVPLEQRGGKWLADVQIRIPVTAMDRLPQGAGSYGQIEVGATFFEESKLSFRFNRALTVQFPERFPDGEIVVQQTVRLGPGSYRGIAVARDIVSGLVGGASLEFEIQKPDSEEIRIAVGRLAKGDVLPPQPDAEIPGWKNARFVAAERKVIWNAEGEAQFHEDAVLVFAYLLPGQGPEPPWLTHELLRDGEVVRTSHPSLKAVGQEGDDLASYEEIPAAALGPGHYSLSIRVGRSATTPLAEVSFEVLGESPGNTIGGRP